MTPLERKLADKLLNQLIAQDFPDNQLINSYRELISASSMRYYIEREIEANATSPPTPDEKDLGGRAPASTEEV